MSAAYEDDMKELLESFIVETNDILEALDQSLMSLESSPEDSDLLNSIFRSFHTIKGTASFMGFERITTITHQAEDLLNKLRRSELQVNTEIVDVLLEVYDWMKILAAKVEAREELDVDYTDTLNTLKRINSGGEAPEQESADSKPEAAADSEPTAETSDHAVDDILNNPEFGQGEGDFTDDELALLEAAFAEVNQNFQNQSGQEEQSKQEAPSDAASTASEPTASKPKDDKKPATTAKPAPSDKKKASSANEARSGGGAEPSSRSAAEATIRVDVNRLEALMDLSGELVLGRNRLTQITQDLSENFDHNEYVRELQETASQINFITTEIQSAIMKTRMVPIAKLFQKAPRMIRDLSREFSKEIQLTMSGEETELDRGIIEELNDPLVHMIRNSCDHGVEKPATRKEAGKDPIGKLHLEAEHEGNNIVIRIIDDGKGIDAEFLKQKAIDKELITEDQAQQMPDREAFNLIFAPGFSTAEKVTNVSGRGVGMDVVRTNIQKLKGIIEIDSTLGAGTTLTIKLPLTLAIIQGLLVRVREEIYAIPLSSVIEVVSTEINQVQTINGKEVIRIRDQVLPLVRLDQTLGTPNAENSLTNRYVVVVGLADFRVGLVVDELMGQKEIVIKSLGEYLGNVNGIAGSTILGDGRVIMIIDIVELVRGSERSVVMQT